MTRTFEVAFEGVGRPYVPNTRGEVSARLQFEKGREENLQHVSRSQGFGPDDNLRIETSSERQSKLLKIANDGSFIERTLAKGPIMVQRVNIEVDWQAA